MKYSEINIGNKQEIFHTITKEDLYKFIELTGDDNKLHLDKSYASKTQFKKPVVHGMLGASFISTIIGTKIPGDGALWFSQTLEFLLPIRVDDKLKITAEVVGKHEREKIIDLKVEIYNQNRQIVTKGMSRVKVIEPLEEHKALVCIPEEKTALVIGATGGIGREVCKKLSEYGYNIIIHYNRNIELANSLREEIKANSNDVTIIKADITNESSIKSLYEKIYRFKKNLDLIVNCAAISIPNIKVENLMWDDLKEQLDINIKSTFHLIKEALPSMIKNKRGKIVTIGSFSVDKPNNDWTHYITAKSALAGLTKALAFELAPKGILVNMVTPSLVDTDLTSDIPEKVKLMVAAQTPLRRLATAKDVAGVIGFLASEDGNFITGQNIRVNGGQIMI